MWKNALKLNPRTILTVFISAFISFGSTLNPAVAQSARSESPANTLGPKILVVGSGINPLSQTLTDSLSASLQNWAGPAPYNGIFEIVGLRNEKTWGIATARPAVDPKTLGSMTGEEEDQSPLIANLFNMLFVRGADVGEIYESATEFDSRINNLLDKVPREELNNNARIALFGKNETQGIDQQFNGYKFPWRAGEAWVITQGWHGSATSDFPSNYAIDFGRNGNPPSESVFQIVG